MDGQTSCSREMPQYQCHKKVWALKIALVKPGAGGESFILPEDSGYAPFLVSAEYTRKHNPQPGGYFVVYEDGYQSYSPAKAFEEGYTLINEPTRSQVSGVGAYAAG